MENTIVIKPDIRQVLIKESFKIGLIIIITLLLGLEGMEHYAPYLRILLIGIALYILLQIIYFKSIRFIITKEQLLFIHGILRRTTEYMELYRIIDYKQECSLLQYLWGISTVTVLSGDKSMPELKMEGVQLKKDVVKTLRERVEMNKAKRGVYEITNRI